MNESTNAVEQADVAERMVAQARPATRIDVKRAQAHQERRRRLINRGVPEDQVDATIAAEDYDALPVEKKLVRFERLMMNAVKGLQNDIINLQHNDRVIADAMDINLRAMGRALAKLGMTEEDQKAIVLAVEQEVRKDQEAQRLAQTVATAEYEKELMKEAIDRPASSEEEVIPEGATVFGS